MFLETDGSLAWLYSCPLLRSPLHTMNECYNKIPNFYRGQIKFVDPITRQKLPDTMPQNCSDHVKTLFQMEMDDRNSWFSLTAQITPRDRPVIFSPDRRSMNNSPLQFTFVFFKQNIFLKREDTVFRRVFTRAIHEKDYHPLVFD